MNPASLSEEYPELGRLRFIRRLSGGGGWNETWLAERGEERLAVRRDTPAVATLGLNRAAENAALHSIRGLGIGPEPVFADIRSGLFVTRWLPGRACTPRDLRRPGLLRALGAVLRRLHEKADPPANAPPLDLARSADHYASLIGSVRARTTARAAVRSLRAAAGHRRQPALCHNDPVAQNILRGPPLRQPDRGREHRKRQVAQNILGGPSLRLIDWEFACPGDPLFDIAVVVGHHGLEDQHARTLLAAAWGRVHPSDRRSLAHLVESYRSLRVLWEAAVRAVTRPAAGGRAV